MNADADLDFLGTGQSVELTFTIRIKDSQGATADQVVTITPGGREAALTGPGISAKAA